MRKLIDLTKGKEWVAVVTRDKDHLGVIKKKEGVIDEFLSQAFEENFTLKEELPNFEEETSIAFMLYNDYRISFCTGISSWMCTRHAPACIDIEKYMNGDDDYIIGIKGKKV